MKSLGVGDQPCAYLPKSIGTSTLARQALLARPTSSRRLTTSRSHASDVVQQLVADPLQVADEVMSFAETVSNRSFQLRGRYKPANAQELHQLVHIQDSEGVQALCDAAGSVRDQQHQVVTFSPKARARAPVAMLHACLLACCTSALSSRSP